MPGRVGAALAPVDELGATDALATADELGEPDGLESPVNTSTKERLG
jgi:hypothetical protein